MIKKGWDLDLDLDLHENGVRSEAGSGSESVANDPAGT